MKPFSAIALGLTAALMTLNTAHAAGVDLAVVEQALKTTGLVGEIHGAVEGQGLYVLTVRAPGDFFTHMEFPLVPEQAAAAEALRGVKRHDRVKIKGEFVQHQAPQKHILVKELEVVVKWTPDPAFTEYEYSVTLPQDLGTTGTAVFKVHAVAGEGRVLVVEYKDVILPVFVRLPAHAALVKDLWRGDRIRMAYRVRNEPDRPVHLMPNPQTPAPEAITVLSRIQEIHGKPARMTGVLAQFPKSPLVMFDIYALQVVDENGLITDYTLVNFADNAVFTAIRQKLAAAWAAHASEARQSRNRWVNPRLKVEAKGVFNEVDAGQANPQILLQSADDVTVTVE